MLSRKNKDKTPKTGLAGKYIKKDSVNPEIKCKFHSIFVLQLLTLVQSPVINVWTEQKNTKPKSRQNIIFDELAASSSKINTKPNNNNSGLANSISSGSSAGQQQGKYTPNPATAIASLAHKFNNIHMTEPTGSMMLTSSQATNEPFAVIRTSTQSHASSSSASSHHQNSHGIYVDIDAIDSFLQQSEADNYQQQQQYSNSGVASQYERNVNTENSIQSLLEASPIYENQVRRSESPIYSNTQNHLYSNVPAITASSSASSNAYANLPPQRHHSILPQSKKRFSFISMRFMIHFPF